MNRLTEVEQALKTNGIADWKFEARQLVGGISEENLERAINRRISGEPLQYILGEWEFYGLPLFVGKGVLIPRPDTETLVDEAISIIGEKQAAVCDLCSGSGAIAIAVAKNTRAKVTAIEISEEALGYLNKNKELNKVSLEVIKGDILSNIETDRFDLILSNPPYIKTGVIPTLSVEVGHEPTLALDGGQDGLIFYNRIASYWKTKLKDGGRLMVEIGYDQAQEVIKIFEQNGFSNIYCKKDLAGNDRVIIGTYTPETT